MKSPRFLIFLVVGGFNFLAVLLFRVIAAAEPQYELSRPVSIVVAGQSVNLHVKQPVTPVGGLTPNADGNVMVKIVLPDGSLSVTPIPAADIRVAEIAAPVAAVTPGPTPAPAKNAVADATDGADKTVYTPTPAPAAAKDQNKQRNNRDHAKATPAYTPGTAPWEKVPAATSLPPMLATTSAGALVPLFDDKTKLDPDTIVDTPEAIITHVGDRARDRHAREWMFHAYDHYLKLYWMYRTVSIEIVDRVAKGGDSITFNITSLFPLNHPNLRMFFQGKGTVAQYTDNTVATTVDPLHYTETIKINTNEHRPLKVGDRLEFEFSPFLLPPVEGRTNYYGTSTLYVVGQGGTQPWEWHTPVPEAEQERGAALDSYPLPVETWLGGRLTLPQQYSDEPKARFQQVATNMSPVDIQPFMLGRRIHHTDFGTGQHSEAGNPVYTEMVGKLGPQFVGRSCIGCHEFNGAAMPSEVGKPMLQYAIHVGSNAAGAPHPDLGSTLQTQAGPGLKAEGGITISAWTETSGTFADGTAYSLRKPSYTFAGITPRFFSVRLAPRLVGEGLLEAVDEKAVAALAAKTKPDGITGHMNILKDPVTGLPRLGRFGWKATQVTLADQIAAAFNNDMGVTTTIFPHRDRGANQPNMDPAPSQMLASAVQKVSYDSSAPSPSETGSTAQVANTDLGNLYRYVALLGVPPQRNYSDPDVIKGQQLFTKANCAECHTSEMKTTPYHPLAELRNETIHPYTDLLVHDMGPGLADNMADGKAAGSEWRTAPLWGVGLSPGVTGGEVYLHDGRARNLSEAILWHGGEAEKAKERFRTMSADDRAALIKFLQSL